MCSSDLLMKAFVFALTKQDQLPDTILCYNSGAYLTCEGADTLEDLKLLVKNRINTLLPNNHFEFIIPTSDYLFRKPNKRIFDFALQRAELKPEDVWYIGDQYEADVKGALGAGLMPVWYQGAIDLPFTADESVLTVQSWAQLCEIMDEQGI